MQGFLHADDSVIRNDEASVICGQGDENHQVASMFVKDSRVGGSYHLDRNDISDRLLPHW